MRKAPAFLLLSVAVPGLSALPVVSPPAAKPKPVAPEVRAVALRGVNEPLLGSAAGKASREVSARFRGAVRDAKRLGRAPSRPAVFAAAEGTSNFELLGVTWQAGSTADLTVLVRAHGDKGWGEWTALEQAPTPAASEGSVVRGGTEPLYTGPSDGYQVRIDVRSGTLPAGVKVDLIDPGSSKADSSVGSSTPAAVASAETSQPTILSRAAWGADERLRSGSPTYMSTVKAGFVHHTAGTNGYPAADVPKIIRGIYAYHTKSNGWSDIGYNYLVDRFGRLWEGRYGGIDRAVKGAHTGGFNQDSFAVSAIGNYDTAAAPSVMTDAISRLMAWRLGRYYRDPNGTTVLTSEGGGTSRYSAGTKVTTKVVSAHRNMGYTECPGNNLYAKMTTIRSGVTAQLGAGLVAPSVTPSTSAVQVKAGVLHAAQTWRIELREAESGYVVRHQTGSGPVDVSVPYTDSLGSPLPGGEYVVSLQSADETGSARPYEQSVSVTGSNQTDAVFLPDGTLAAATRTASGAVTVQLRDRSGTEAAVDLKGVAVGRPTAALTSDGRLVVAVRGSSGMVYLKRRSLTGSWPTTWERIPVVVAGSPAVVAAGDALQVLAQGTDRALWSWTSAGVGQWSAGTNLGGRLMAGSSVGAVRSADGVLHVMVHGIDGSGWYRRQVGTTWDELYTALGGSLRGDVDMAPGSTSKSVVVSGWGNSGRPYLLTVTSGVKQGTWARVGSMPIATAPALADRSAAASTKLLARDQQLRLVQTAIAGLTSWALAL